MVRVPDRPAEHQRAGDAPLNEPANGGTNCDASHVVNLDNPTNGLVARPREQHAARVSSRITPDNCSDAHDAVCKGNNLSGAFNADGSPNYQQPRRRTPIDPEMIPPVNQTGGLYVSDLFLEYYIPLIEQSQAFRQGGLIDITFDEGFPPFTYSGNSFNYEPDVGPGPAGQRTDVREAGARRRPARTPSTGPTGSRATPPARTSASQNSAPPSRPARTRRSRPTGRATSSIPVPGTTATSTARPPARRSARRRHRPICVPGIVRGGSGSSPGARTATRSRRACRVECHLRTPPSSPTTPEREVSGTGIPAKLLRRGRHQRWARSSPTTSFGLGQAAASLSSS